MQFWKDLEGETLGSIYRLKRYVHGDESSALFTTEANAQNPSAPDVRVFRTEIEPEEQLLQRLETARQLHHPNLVRIEKVDAAELNGVRVVYAVAEHTDENLADALRERALIPDETREVVRSVASALGAIHARDLVHGDIQPSNIFATSETIKLRSDSIVKAGTAAGSRELRGAQLAPEAEETGLSSAAEVWSLGVLIFEALKQRRPISEDDEEIGRLPPPFASIVSHCLSKEPAERWKVEQVATALAGETMAAPAQAAPEPPSRGVQRLSVRQPAAARATADPREADQFDSAYPRRRPVPAKHRSIPASLYAGGVVFALVLAGWLLLRPRAPKPATTRTPQITTAEQHVATPDGAAVEHNDPAMNPADQTPAVSGPPVTHKQSPMGRNRHVAPADQRPANTPTVPPSSQAAAGERSVWRVVAYTYGKAEDAQRKVEQIKTKHPELGPEVFSAEPNQGPYLVVLGGQMDKDEATRLKRKAVSEGMPRDTYAQNYSR